MTPEQQKDWSIKMGMSVLLGKNIYNIAELVSLKIWLRHVQLDKEILKVILGTDFEWLYHLLQAIGTGNIDGFEKTLADHQDNIGRFVS